jgi:hypothetical protein
MGDTARLFITRDLANHGCEFHSQFTRFHSSSSSLGFSNVFRCQFKNRCTVPSAILAGDPLVPKKGLGCRAECFQSHRVALRPSHSCSITPVWNICKPSNGNPPQGFIESGKETLAKHQRLEAIFPSEDIGKLGCCPNSRWVMRATRISHMSENAARVALEGIPGKFRKRVMWV